MFLNALKLAKDLYYREHEGRSSSIGVIGNSAGGSIGNLIARIEPEVKALVLDYISTFNEGGIGELQSTNCPELYLLSNSIVFATEQVDSPEEFDDRAEFPALQLPNEGVDPSQHGSFQSVIFAFFDQYLK